MNCFIFVAEGNNFSDLHLEYSDHNPKDNYDYKDLTKIGYILYQHEGFRSTVWGYVYAYSKHEAIEEIKSFLGRFAETIKN